MRENNIVYIALGSNLGNREKYLEKTIKKISEFAQITKKSSIYETKPVGYKDQGDFLNMVIEITTQLRPYELLKKLQKIETSLKRKREIKNGPRTIDLDIIFYNYEIINEKNLKIPHPEMHKRNFVLNPLVEIAPFMIHPVLKQNILSLQKDLK